MGFSNVVGITTGVVQHARNNHRYMGILQRKYGMVGLGEPVEWSAYFRSIS